MIPPTQRRLAERRRVARHRRALGYWGVLLALLLSLWIGTTVVPPAWLHTPPLFGHLASVIAGLGAAVLLELSGLLWMLRRAAPRRPPSCRAPGRAPWRGSASPGCWRAGAFLQPDLGQPLTAIKMVAVLIVAMNGVAMTRLTDELARLPGRVRFSALPRRLQAWCVWSAVVSQVGVVDRGASSGC